MRYDVLPNSKKCEKDQMKRRYKKNAEGNMLYYYTEDGEGNKIFCHSPQTWKQLRNEQVMSRNRKGRLKYKRIGKLSQETYDKNTNGKIRQHGRHADCEKGKGRYIYSDRIGKVHQTKCVTYNEYLREVHDSQNRDSRELTPTQDIKSNYSRVIQKTLSHPHKLHRRRGPVSRKKSTSSALEASLMGLAGIGY